MKKELIIFVGIFLFLAIGMHFKQWISIPVEHIINLPTAGAYGIGAIHPLVFTIAAYIALWIPRGVLRVFKKR